MCRLKFPLRFLMVDSTRYIKKQKGQLSLKLLLETSKTIRGGGGAFPKGVNLMEIILASKPVHANM